MSDLSNVVRSDSYVTLHYEISATLAGRRQVLVSTGGTNPVTLQLGHGQLAEPIERRLIGLAEGAEAGFHLAPDEAYGVRRPELVQKVSRTFFDSNVDPLVQHDAGDVVEFTFPGEHKMAGVLKSMDERSVIVDFNHPLAGLALEFSARIVGVL
jgi:FKBP-type peptidyl-prolyl cis-trans isomerase SlpA